MLTQQQKLFLKLLDELVCREGWRRSEAMRHFLTCASSAVRKSTCLGPEAEACEAAYMRVVGLCRKDGSMDRMAELFGLVVDGLEAEIHDFLGPIFMETVSNPAMGQFFTPDSLCQATAQLTLQGAGELLEQQPVISIDEPAVGTGGMVLACCNVLRKQGINYQNCVYFRCTDLDLDAFQGAYLQLSLVGAAALVIQGNTLSLEVRQQAITPMLLYRPWLAPTARPFQVIAHAIEQLAA